MYPSDLRFRQMGASLLEITFITRKYYSISGIWLTNHFTIWLKRLQMDASKKIIACPLTWTTCEERNINILG